MIDSEDLELPEPVAVPIDPPDEHHRCYGILMAEDAIEKIEAGFALTHALYHLPVEKIKALLKDATPGFADTFGRAQGAYGVGKS